MKIRALKELDDGVKGVKITGWVKKILPPKHMQGVSQNTQKPYDFWTQFIVLQDGTENIDSIGVDLTLENDAQQITQERIKITVTGTVASYPKDGQTHKKLSRGKFEAAVPTAGQQSTTTQQTQDKPDWDAIAERKCFYGLMQAMIQSGISPMAVRSNRDELEALDELAGYCMEGLPPKPAGPATAENVDHAREEAEAAAAVRRQQEEDDQQSAIDEEIPF